MITEDKSCFNCKYFDCTEYEEPCVNCKHALVYSDPKYNETPLLWEDKHAVEVVSDVVNHPNHYTNGGMECIDEMIAVFGKQVVADFCLCNVWKYRYRATSKNGQEDIEKSHWYMAKYMELRGDSCEQR